MTENSVQDPEGLAAPAPVPAKGFGTLLREAREAAGLSLDDVASRTKISRNQLEALEAESVRLLPEPVYVRAFIRDICCVTGGDPKPAIEAYMQACAPAEQAAPDFQPAVDVPKHGLVKEVEFRASPRKKGLRVLIAFAAVVVVALLAWAGWGQDLVARLGGSDIEAVKVTQQSGSVAALQRPRSPSNALPADAPVTASMNQQAQQSAASDATAVSSPAASSAQATGADSQAAAPAQPAALPGQVTVVVRTVGASWLKMTDADGKVLVKEELGAGVEKTYVGKLPISVTVGNARSCAMTIDGRTIDLSAYSRGSVARFVLNPEK